MQSTSEKLKDNSKKMHVNDIKCWIITEGMAGTENQCLGVAEYLDLSSVTVKRIGLKFPFNFLSPFVFKRVPHWAVINDDWPKGQNKQWPDLVIASGRKAVPAALSIPNTCKVFIQDPRINPKYFDLVAVPQHDKTRGDNVIITTAAPNRINPSSLNTAMIEFAPELAALPDKKIAIMIGGNSKTHTMPDDFAKKLFAQLLPFMKSGDCGFMITASRRTPEPIRKQLKNLFSTPNCYFWDSTGDNPYKAFLAYADIVLVTEDSTSMLSDALTAGKPTYRIPLIGASAKFERLYKNLENMGGLRKFAGDLEVWDYEPLNDAKLIADEIKKHFAK